MQSEDASLAWGPLTAGTFSADFQNIAWSGAGFVTYGNGRTASADDGASAQTTPPDVHLFNRQVAADSNSVEDLSQWQPQVWVSVHMPRVGC